MEIKSVLRYFKRQGKKEGVMVDVGAHVGSVAKSFAALGWHVYCFEPESANYAELVKNMATFPKVHCLSLAVSNEDGQDVSFYVSDQHWGIHSLRPWHTTHHLAYTVQTTRLDTFLRAHSIDHVDFFKIDIEGADFLALQGIGFDAYHPAAVVTEFMDSRTEQAYGYNHHDVVRYMTVYGYDCIVFEYSSVVEYARKDRDTPVPAFLGAYPYAPTATPDWGNLVFYTQGDKAFELAVEKTLAQPSPMRWAWVPSPLRALLRPAKRWLESRLQPL